ncbi:hypothetical protein [Streptomyces sp. NPDC058872]|uniref:hypothetical protein n=1 Tax=Streptomyces sp. NPDC058872 TaxID=3346661 RepID=UPI0036B25A49
MAEEEVERCPEAPGGLFTVEATRAQVDAYRISVHNAPGTPDKGVKIAHILNMDLIPTAERGRGPTQPGCGTRSATVSRRIQPVVATPCPRRY